MSDSKKAGEVTAVNHANSCKPWLSNSLKEVKPTDQAKFLDATGPEVMQVPVLSRISQSAAWLLGGEGEHVGEQLKALRTFHQTTQEIKVTWPNSEGVLETRSVMAKFDVIAMNFGVNPARRP